MRPYLEDVINRQPQIADGPLVANPGSHGTDQGLKWISSMGLLLSEDLIDFLYLLFATLPDSKPGVLLSSDAKAQQPSGSFCPRPGSRPA